MSARVMKAALARKCRTLAVAVFALLPALPGCDLLSGSYGYGDSGSYGYDAGSGGSTWAPASSALDSYNASVTSNGLWTYSGGTGWY